MSDPERLYEMAEAAWKRKWANVKNLGKGTWLTMSDGEIVDRIADELNELGQALNVPDDWDDVVAEAVDVLAFALMGADPERHPVRHGDERDDD